MEVQKPYHYSSSDIQKYLSGKMSANEMHQMESAALNDPLLSDAIDGFSKHAVSASELVSLKEKIIQIPQPKQNNSKQIYFYLSVAASLFFILFFGYQFFNKDSQKKVLMAQKETKQQVKPQIATSTEKISNIKTNKDNPSPIIEKKAAVAESKVNSSNEIISTDNSSLSSSSAIRDNSIVENKDNGIVENAVPLAATEDENAKPINVDVKSDAQQFTATNDLTKEEVTTNTTAAVNAVPQASRLDKVVLKKTNEQDIKSNSYPVIGWNEYQNYINNNIRKTIENSSLTIKGAVVLGFKVNKKGKPQGIRIIQSLSEACDKEAIRLIETGPEWKKADNKMVNYSIIF